MFGDVEAFAFCLGIGPQANGLVEDEEQDGRTDTRPEQRQGDRFNLGDQLARHVIFTSNCREDGIVEPALTA